jgi:hypothetical protein
MENIAVPVLNWRPCHEDVLGEWRYSSTYGGEWSASRPGLFTTGERVPPVLNGEEAEWALEPV